MKFLFLALFVSCGHIQFDPRGIPREEHESKRIPNKEFWLGKSVDDLLTHPGYAIMPLEKRDAGKGKTLYIFQNNAGKESRNLTGFFNKRASVDVICSHIFHILNNKVSDYVRGGTCHDEWDSLRPIGKDGEPEKVPSSANAHK